MKFSQMKYERPDAEQLKAELNGLTEKLKAAKSYTEAKELFLAEEKLNKHISTLANLAHIRHTIDTRDAFYDGEMKFWNKVDPELEECQQGWTQAMLESPYRKDFAEEYGNLMFLKAEIKCKTFSPVIIEELQKENELADEYEKLLASAQIPFEGGVYTLSQLTPFKSDPDDARRLAAWKAEGNWYKENQAKLDDLYDQLVHLRDKMGKKLGYEGYTTLGYYRMGRNCYTKEDVEKFRKAVVKYLVPVADSIYREQAKRLGKEYPMSFADNALEFRSGNPKPIGTPDEILAMGRKFYDELSPETSEFFRMMLDNELLDVLSTEGKRSGGYCTSIADYEVPFIFANFNGTQHDVEVVTHEAGHAFNAYMIADNEYATELGCGGMETAETHSMSMEFLAWPYMEKFFGENAAKYRFMHALDSFSFIPYGTMVDAFQHIVYENPDMTPAQRKAAWRELESQFRPYIDFDGVPYLEEGTRWQYQMHIYESPFYYIDYCLAQTAAFGFLLASQEDYQDAFARYIRLMKQGGEKVWTDLLEEAGITSPFRPGALHTLAQGVESLLTKIAPAE